MRSCCTCCNELPIWSYRQAGYSPILVPAAVSLVRPTILFFFAEARPIATTWKYRAELEKRRPGPGPDISCAHANYQFHDATRPYGGPPLSARYTSHSLSPSPLRLVNRYCACFRVRSTCLPRTPGRHFLPKRSVLSTLMFAFSFAASFDFIFTRGHPQARSVTVAVHISCTRRNDGNFMTERRPYYARNLSKR